MTLYQAILSGIIQGLSEFLPISSSGHLVLLHNIFGIKKPQLIFDLYLHLGTLLAVLIVFFKDLINTFTKNKKEIKFLIVAMIPIILIALLFNDRIESFFAKSRLTACMLIVTGIWLIAASWRQKIAIKRTSDINLWQSILIGCAQGVSLIPGISRSGATISTGLLSGVEQKKAVTFSFLLSILAISSALIFKSKELSSITESIDVRILIAGVISSFIFGFIAIKIVLETVKRRKLHFFGLYCIVVGSLGIIFLR